MKPTKYILILVICTIGMCMCRCKTEEILPGVIIGYVTDAETSLPLQGAKVILNPSNDTTNTASDGEYLFDYLTPGNYEIQASKLAYERKKNSVAVTPASTNEIDFALSGIPVPEISVHILDFGLDSTIQMFTISNIGKAPLKYSLLTDQQWISIYPASGEVTNKADTIMVTINRSELSDNIQLGEIKITSIIGQENLDDVVRVFANGVMDRDLNYYNVIKIGTQIWMAENLNIGIMVGGGTEQPTSQIIKKYCYNNDDVKCNIFGGLYTWAAMMQGAKEDNGDIGTTNGICPAGWHVPTMKEWNVLTDFLNVTVAGIKLKEEGETHWKSGNIASNESGFTALAGGRWNGTQFDLISTHEYFWTASIDQNSGYSYAAQLEYNSERVFFPKIVEKQAIAVRCIMDPSKK